MTLEKLQKDMIAAMKARDKERKDSISSLVSGMLSLQQLRRSESITAAETTFLRI